MTRGFLVYERYKEKCDFLLCICSVYVSRKINISSWKFPDKFIWKTCDEPSDGYWCIGSLLACWFLVSFIRSLVLWVLFSSLNHSIVDIPVLCCMPVAVTTELHVYEFSLSQKVMLFRVLNFYRPTYIWTSRLESPPDTLYFECRE